MEFHKVKSENLDNAVTAIHLGHTNGQENIDATINAEIRASRRDEPTSTEISIAVDADINKTTNQCGQTALIEAISAGDIYRAQMLLYCKVNIDTGTVSRTTRA